MHEIQLLRLRDFLALFGSYVEILSIFIVIAKMQTLVIAITILFNEVCDLGQ